MWLIEPFSCNRILLLFIFGMKESLILNNNGMKKLCLVIFITILSVSLNAQTGNSLIFGKALVKYQHMEKAGTVLTILGGATLFTGNVLYWKVYNHPNGETPATKAVTYRNIMFGGLGLMAVGIPLWSIGRTKERRITIEARIVRFNGYVSANGAGMVVRF